MLFRSVWLAGACFFDADGVVLLDCDCLGCFCQVAHGMTTLSAGFSMKKKVLHHECRKENKCMSGHYYQFFLIGYTYINF